MGPERTPNGLFREPDGSFSASYGPFILRTGLQPIFSQNSRGELKLEAFEALVRPFKSDGPVPPPQFFEMVQKPDAAEVERLCRRLHLSNMATARKPEALLFLNFNPQLFRSYSELLAEAEALARDVRSAGLHSAQIVCEIIEKEASSRSLLASLVEALRERHFKIAIDDYGADDSDFERVSVLKPDIVKFDALWVQRFLETQEGFALLRTMVRQFRDNGIMTLFEGLEEHWQVAACRELGVRLLQGFVLARPELAARGTGLRPVRVDRDAGSAEGMREEIRQVSEPAPSAQVQTAFGTATRRRAVFGRRGR